MQWWWLEGLLSGWRWRLGRTVVAPCPPEFSCTDQGWRVNPEDVSPTHQSNITPVEPTGKAKSFSTFLFLIFMWGLFTRWQWKPEEHLNLTSETWPKEVKDEVLGRPRKWGETSWTDWSTTPKVVNFSAISLNFENTLKIFLDRKKTFVRNHPEHLLQKDQENSQILAGCSAVAVLLFLSRLLSWVRFFLINM